VRRILRPNLHQVWVGTDAGEQLRVWLARPLRACGPDLATENHKSELLGSWIMALYGYIRYESGLLGLYGCHASLARAPDGLRRCTRPLGGPDRDANSVRASTETDKNGPFVSPVCVGPLEMPLVYLRVGARGMCLSRASLAG
jgi:hypothetical protein